MSDTATASAAIPPLNIMHIVYLPGALGGLELHSYANVHLSDRELFYAIAERYGATAKHYKGTPTLDPFDSFELTIEGQQVNVFLSDTARNSVNTVIEQVAA